MLTWILLNNNKMARLSLNILNYKANLKNEKAN